MPTEYEASGLLIVGASSRRAASAQEPYSACCAALRDVDAEYQRTAAGLLRAMRGRAPGLLEFFAAVMTITDRPATKWSIRFY